MSTSPSIFDQYRQSVAALPPPPTPNLAGMAGPTSPGGVPSNLNIPMPAAPNVQRIPTQLENDQSKYQQVKMAGPGEEQLYHKITGSQFGQNHPILGKVLGGLAAGVTGAADIGVGTLGGGLGRLAEEQIPGTLLNHQVQLNRAGKDITTDEANAGKEAQTASENATAAKTTADTAEVAPEAEARIGQENATAGHENAETENLKNPPANLAVAYAHAVQDAMKRGVDPSADPIVGHLSDAITAIQKQPAAKGSEHVNVLGDDGKPTMGNYDPASGRTTDAAGNIIKNPRPIPPPPSYGQLVLPSKVETFIDPKTGIPTMMQYDPKTQTYSKTVGTSSTGAYGHEEAQAGAVERAGADLLNTLQANKKDLGTLGAWVAKYGLNTPIADPKLAGIQAQMGSFAALNPAMHGARGLQAIQHFEKLIGGLQQNPDASIAGIQAIINTAHEINPGVNPQGAPGQGKTFDSGAWAKANPKGDVNAARTQAKQEGYEVK